MKEILLLIVIFFLFPLSVFAGTDINLATTTTWNIRTLGDVASLNLGYPQSGQQARAYGDFNGDGIKDVVWPASGGNIAGRTGSGAVFVVYGNLFSSLTGTGNDFSLVTTTNYKFKYYAAANANLGSGAVTVADIDGDGLDDLIMAASYADTNGSNSGAVYIVKGSLMDDYSTYGNDIDLTTAGNYNMRFDGPVAGGYLGNTQLATAHFDNDTAIDLVMAAHHANLNGADSGSVYLIYDDILSTFTGTGNNIALATSSNYTRRFDGGAGNTLGGGSFAVGNFDGDSLDDLLVGTDFASYNSRSNSGSLWLIYDDLLSSYSSQSVIITTDTNWNVRIDGATAGDRIVYGSLHTGDLDNNGKSDILVGSWNSGYNSRSLAGFLYWIPDSLFTAPTGTGNTIDLNTSSNYKARFDGALANGRLTFSGIGVINFFNVGGLDLVMSEIVTEAVYVISNTSLNAISGNGNNIDLLDSNNYTLKYTSTGNRTILNGGYMPDLDGNGSEDLVITGYRLDNGALVDAGGGYYIYNFPHTISVSSATSPNVDSTPTLTGSVTATGNSVYTVAGVEYKADSNTTGTGWTACTAGDGSFNSSSESYSCTITSALTDGSHTLYFRAYDTLGARTAQANYAQATLTIDTTAPSVVAIVEPVGYITNVSPVLVFKKATDTSGISSYSVFLDQGRNRSFSVSGIPSSGNGSASYVWRDDDIVKVEFLNENDSNADNDLIRVYFKGLSGAGLTEGKHSWSVTVNDAVSNQTTKTTEFYLDRTAPFITELAVVNVSAVSDYGGYQLESGNRTPLFSGRAIDIYQGSERINADGTKDAFDKVASGPEKVTLTIKKLVEGGLVYENYLVKEVELTNVKDEVNVEKSARFYISVPYPLTDGYYRVEFSLKDLAGNNYLHKPFYLSLNYTLPSVVKEKLAEIDKSSENVVPTTPDEISSGEEKIATGAPKPDRVEGKNAFFWCFLVALLLVFGLVIVYFVWRRKRERESN